MYFGVYFGSQRGFVFCRGRTNSQHCGGDGNSLKIFVLKDRISFLKGTRQGGKQFPGNYVVQTQKLFGVITVC